jgi:hypothetical protein
VHEDLIDVVVDRRHEQRERLRTCILGTEHRIIGIAREHDVHLADHLAEAPNAREERLRTFPQLLDGKRPAVDRARYELLHESERRAHERAFVSHEPAAEQCG